MFLHHWEIIFISTIIWIFYWGLSIFLEEFVQMSLSDELHNIILELDTYFGRMAEIFMILAKSLQVSFSDRHSDRTWVLQEVIFFRIGLKT